MPGVLGGLVVSLALDAADFSSGLNKAELQAQKFSESIGKGVAGAAGLATAGFLAIEAAAELAIAAIKKFAGEAAEFQHLADATGANSEALASFAVAAAGSTTSMEQIARLSERLSRNFAKLTDDTTDAGAALESIGINAKKFQQLSPDEQILALAKAFNNFADGGGKTAAAIALMGKNGAELLPFLKQLAQVGPVHILTQEQIELADQFTASQARLHEQVRLTFDRIAVDALPALISLSKAAKDTIEGILGLDDGVSKLVTDAKLRKWAEEGARLLGILITVGQVVAEVFLGITIVIAAGIAEAVALATGNISEMRRLGAKTLEELHALADKPLFSAKLDEAIAFQHAVEAGPPEPPGFKRPDKPQVPFKGGDATKKAADQRKAELDAVLKADEIAFAREQQILNDRESFLSLYYTNDLIGVRQFYQARRDAQTEALAKETAALNDEIAALQKFAKQAKPGADREQAETRVTEAIARRDKVQQQAAQNAQMDFAQEQFAVEKLIRSFDDAATALKAMQGDSVGAGMEAFNAAHRQMQLQINALAQSTKPEDQDAAAQAQKVLDQTTALTRTRLELDKATQNYNNTLELLAIDQQKVDIAQSTGALSTLDALRAKSELAAKYTTILQGQLAAAEALAAQTGKAEDIIAVQKLQVQLQALAATGDLVAKQFQDIFAGAFVDAITAAVSGTKSLKDAFLDMAKSIEQAITRIAAQRIAESLFPKSGQGGPFDLAKLLSGLFSPGTAVTGSIDPGAFVPPGGGLASGTSFWRGGPTLVGEQGPEIVNLPRGASVTPANQAVFGHRMNFSINVLPGANRRTAEQAATATGIAVQRAMVRNA